MKSGNRKAQEGGITWLIIGAVVMILAIVTFLLVFGKGLNVSRAIVKILGGG